ncbi:MAG: arginase family protein [Gibbsiella quercinecans]|uniref:Arginase n=1 Tax=Gibbsiella quercinecans TaxID=929813 RepID=A0A250B146_9GAMM|nr:arginase family protein [Gibbsiella quercinecans]ATA19884.1 arginase [Gibbsiella quercinecans]RLM04893.1 arginase [Gibbsiella quercinecans]RLM10128.1 arginase [Gibbsiella quercinecans]RLM16295.1 arginase [Gibbsiella quercinecans]TCT89671.1 arginase [Gibbsiella quercinecans]
MSNQTQITVFQGIVGDRNDLARPGAMAIGKLLAQRFGLTPEIIGASAAVIGGGWREALDAAKPSLNALSGRLDHLFAENIKPFTASSRCAASLATLPVVARYHPEACIVWFDAHADLNTPATSATGYLGGFSIAGPVGLWDSGLGSGVDLSAVILVGARDIDPPEQKLIDDGKLQWVAAGDGLVEGLKRAINGRAVYVHLDCDVLAPDIVPTEYRVPGGLSLDDLYHACQVIAENAVIGVEIAEFQISQIENGSPVSPASLLDALSPLINGLNS